MEQEINHYELYSEFHINLFSTASWIAGSSQRGGGGRTLIPKEFGLKLWIDLIIMNIFVVSPYSLQENLGIV
jgi:hypothetical protein